MSDVSTILSLPYLMPSQAQKHITHNEALRLLDVLVQLSVADRTLTTPPPLPEPGERHLVAPGAGGAWAGQEGRIAVHEAGTWFFLTPQPGWRAHVLAEGRTLTHDGTAWQDGSASVLRAAGLGIGAEADALNRISVAAPATLLSHEGAGHQLKVNKAAPGDTASLVFQTGWSGRAEMGLAGSDRFAVKVSADGSAFTEALSADPATGRLHLPQGAEIAGSIIGSAVTQGPADATAGRLIRTQDGYVRSTILGTVAQAAGVPTGAILERGANANGEYLRLADGTQICTSPALSSGAVTTASGAVFQSASITWTFPAAFAAGAPPVVAGGAGNAARWLSVAQPGVASVFFRVNSTVSSAAAADARLVATGRWF